MTMNNSSDILADVARIARVPVANHRPFVRLLSHAIKRAEKESSRPAPKNISAGSLHRDFFGPIAEAAHALRVGLQRLDGYHLVAGEAGRAMVASSLFSEVLPFLSKTDDAHDDIAEFVRSMKLDLIINSAERASERAKRDFSKAGRKKGTGYIAFDMFVMRLLAACEQTRVKLTIYRTSYGDTRLNGSLVKAVQQLRQILPQTNFFPASKLGYSLHNLHYRWRVGSGKSALQKAGKSRPKKIDF
jgi:hypothetical protein